MGLGALWLTPTNLPCCRTCIKKPDQDFKNVGTLGVMKGLGSSVVFPNIESLLHKFSGPESISRKP